MKLKKINLFHTPGGWQELQNWIERHAPEERAHLTTAAGMAWNLAVELTNLPEPEPKKTK